MYIYICWIGHKSPNCLVLKVGLTWIVVGWFGLGWVGAGWVWVGVGLGGVGLGGVGGLGWGVNLST